MTDEQTMRRVLENQEAFIKQDFQEPLITREPERISGWYYLIISAIAAGLMFGWAI